MRFVHELYDGEGRRAVPVGFLVNACARRVPGLGLRSPDLTPPLPIRVFHMVRTIITYRYSGYAQQGHQQRRHRVCSQSQPELGLVSQWQPAHDPTGIALTRADPKHSPIANGEIWSAHLPACSARGCACHRVSPSANRLRFLVVSRQNSFICRKI